MQDRWSNCNIWGNRLANLVHCCFRPDIDVCVYRDGESEDIYRGNAADLPSLQGYKVINIQFDDYLDIFFVEVK